MHTRIKNFSLTTLLDTLSNIKGSKVTNITSGHVYTNHQLPTLKYYNINNSLQAFNLEDSVRGIGSLTVVGTSVLSSSVPSCGSENIWGGKLMVVSLDSAIDYIKNFTMKHSSCMSFSDNAYPTKDALNQIIIESERVFKKLTSSFKKKYRVAKKNTLPKTLEEMNYKINSYDFSFDVDTIPSLDYIMSDVDTNNKQIMSVSVFGSNDFETYHKVELMIKKVKKDYKYNIVGMNRYSGSGQDWNSRIFQSGGKFVLYFVQ